MLEAFRRLLLNLPMNPKYGKTRDCQPPSMKHLCCVVVVGGGFFGEVERKGSKLFQTRRGDFGSLIMRGLSPLWFTAIFYLKNLQSSVLFTLKLH